MQYLTTEDIKHQIIMDQDFCDDDPYLELLGSTAENMLNDNLDGHLQDIVIRNGYLPEQLRVAMLLLVGYLYEDRGDKPQIQIPNAYYRIINPYIHYPIA